MSDTYDADAPAGNGDEAREPASGAGSDPDEDGSIPDLYPHIVDRADYDPDFDPDAPVTCDRCGNTMHYTGQCKLVCEVCGYMRDCSDP